MSNPTSTLAKIKRHAISLYISPFLHRDSKDLFASLAKQAREKYLRHRDDYDYSEFLMPSWQKNTDEIEKVFLDGLPFSFLRNQMLKHTMFTHLPKAATNIQKKLIAEKCSDDSARNILREHSAGKPILNDSQFTTSGNSIHHLYHLLKFEKEAGFPLTELESVIEFGGGYGNMAKLLKQINPNATYTIIDIPIFSYIQYVYLCTILGPDNVVLFDDTRTIVSGKVNIVPMHKPYLELLQTKLPTLDIFISTWALSETNQATQTMVRHTNYFNAKYLLLAYQKANETFSYAQDIEKLPDTYKAIYQSETGYLNNNFYLFAKRN